MLFRSVLKYNLVNTITGPNGKYELSIPAAPVALIGSDIPRLQLVRGDRLWKVQPSADPAVTTLDWTMEYLLADNNKVQGAGDVDLSALTLTCSPAVYAQPILSPTITAGATSKRLTIDVNAQFQGAAPDPATNSYSQCTLTGTVTYTLAGSANALVSKPFPDTVIYYPQHVSATQQPSEPVHLPVGRQPQ